MKLRANSRTVQVDDFLSAGSTYKKNHNSIRENSPATNRLLCEGCAKCCMHINHEIDPPRNDEDCDYIIWFLLHENISVWVDDEHVWYIEFKTPCKGLQNELCSIYDRRPQVCREYSQENCLNTELDDDIVFNTPEEFLEYVRKNNLHQYYGFYRGQKKATRLRQAAILLGWVVGILFIALGMGYALFLLGVMTPLAIALLMGVVGISFFVLLSRATFRQKKQAKTPKEKSTTQ